MLSSSVSFMFEKQEVYCISFRVRAIREGLDSRGAIERFVRTLAGALRPGPAEWLEGGLECPHDVPSPSSPNLLFPAIVCLLLPSERGVQNGRLHTDVRSPPWLRAPSAKRGAQARV